MTANNNLLSQVIEHANKNYDGHFSLFKFTTNWRVCYGTVCSRGDIGQMHYGNTMDEVLQKLINDPISVYDFKDY